MTYSACIKRNYKEKQKEITKKSKLRSKSYSKPTDLNQLKLKLGFQIDCKKQRKHKQIDKRVSNLSQEKL